MMLLDKSDSASTGTKNISDGCIALQLEPVTGAHNVASEQTYWYELFIVECHLFSQPLMSKGC